MVPAPESRQRGHRWQFTRTLASRLTQGAIIGALGGLLGVTACGEFHLSTSNLQIGPDPAVPGDMVVALFVLRLVPTQRHTIVLMIDNTEHLRLTSDEAPANPVILDLGDAADLIAKYGVGAHSAFVEVHAHEANETTRTQSASFQLNEATP
jgi:hypothetical protein